MLGGGDLDRSASQKGIILLGRRHRACPAKLSCSLIRCSSRRRHVPAGCRSLLCRHQVQILSSFRQKVTCAPRLWRACSRGGLLSGSFRWCVSATPYPRRSAITARHSRRWRTTQWFGDIPRFFSQLLRRAVPGVLEDLSRRRRFRWQL